MDWLHVFIGLYYSVYCSNADPRLVGDAAPRLASLVLSSLTGLRMVRLTVYPPMNGVGYFQSSRRVGTRPMEHRNPFQEQVTRSNELTH